MITLSLQIRKLRLRELMQLVSGKAVISTKVLLTLVDPQRVE